MQCGYSEEEGFYTYAKSAPIQSETCLFKLPRIYSINVWDHFLHKDDFLQIMKKISVNDLMTQKIVQVFAIALRMLMEHQKLDKAYETGDWDNLSLFGSNKPEDIEFWEYMLSYYYHYLEIDTVDIWTDDEYDYLKAVIQYPDDKPTFEQEYINRFKFALEESEYAYLLEGVLQNYDKDIKKWLDIMQTRTHEIKFDKWVQMNTYQGKVLLSGKSRFTLEE